MNKPKGRNVTSHDVAEAAGVSQSVVSRAFSKGRSVAPETRKRVLRVANELGYHPNAFARGLARDETALVGILMARVDNHFYPAVLELLGSRLRASGRQILFFTDDEEGGVDPILKTALQYRVDAMILTSATLSSRMAHTFSENDIPTILFNRTLDVSTVASVACDNEAGGASVARHLLAGGHRRFAYVGGAPDASTNVARREGYLRTLRGAGMTNVIVVEHSYSYAWGRTAATQLLSGDEPPDAVFCASDVVAFGFLDAARHAFGLQVPSDVSVVGFDDTPTAGWAAFDLTTVRQPVERMVDATMDILEDPAAAAAGPARLLPGELVVRGTSRQIRAQPTPARGDAPGDSTEERG